MSGKRSGTDTASLISLMTTMDAATQTEEPGETSTASQVSTVMDAETQTEEYDYLLDARPNGYKTPDKDFFDSDKKVRFYTGLPSGEILMVVFFDIHSFKDLFIVYGGDGFATFSLSFLARQGKSLEDNAYILSVRFWKAGHSNY